MNTWHASTELHTAGRTVVAKPGYAATGLETGYALGLSLDTAARTELEAALSDTSG